MIPSATCIRRSALELAGGFNPMMRYCEDWDLFFRVSLLGSIGRVREANVLYRQHNDSVSRNHPGTYRASTLVLDSLQLYAQQQGRADLLPHVARGRRHIRQLFSHQAFTAARRARETDQLQALGHLGRALILDPTVVLNASLHKLRSLV